MRKNAESVGETAQGFLMISNRWNASYINIQINKDTMVDYCTTSAAQLDCESLIKCNLLHLNAALLQLCLENSFIYLFLSSLSTLHSSLLCPCLIVMRQIYVLLSASERSCRKLPPYRFSCNNSARRRSLFLHTHFDTFIHLLSY